ncbi:hypothetical protein C1646_767298 [Rhizophagus diaphanus]|nr:hypothetical protein C1646_767298 [Rhizophagus diaphanus] [Rhizophagus sp. MUCL 43196]
MIIEHYTRILINKLWCRLAIPFLWKNPFSINYPKNYCYIDVYLHDLSEDDKTKLNEYGIKIRVFSSNTLFNYYGFFKCLKTCDFKSSIEDWMSIKNEYLYQQSSQQQLLRLIYTSLIEIFVKNETNLHTFEFNGNYYENIILEIILQNPKFIHNIRNLFITFISNNESDFIMRPRDMSWIDDIILRCIKKYIMKEKRVKYLAINVTEQVLANEAKEFKLYNIEFTSMCKIYNYLPDLL